MKSFIKIVGGLSIGVAALAVAVPSAAQDYASQGDEIVVQGHYGRVPDNADSLSQTVSFADLDLGTDLGQRILDHRIKMTARYLCDRLGESDTTDPLTPSCRETAYRDAVDRMGTEDQDTAPRHTAWVPPAHPRAWRPAYPASWDDGYDSYTGYP
jgi:UrcA family protein